MIWRTTLFLFIVVAMGAAEVLAQTVELEFPNNFDHAGVSVYPLPQLDEYLPDLVRFSSDGQPVSAAKGTVSIPANAWLSVDVVCGNGCTDFVASLSKHKIDRLELRGASVSEKLIATIEQIELLSELHLIDCHFDSLDASQLRGLRNLRELTIRGENEVACWRCLTPWLAKCPAIQFPFSGIEMEASDLKVFADKPGATFLRVALSQDSGDIIGVLEVIPGLVGLELELAENVKLEMIERLCTIQNIQSIVLNGAVLDADLVRTLSHLKKLKVLRVQGSTKVEDFLSNGLPFPKLEAISINHSLEAGLQQRFIDACLRHPTLREFPNLANATSSQLSLLAKKSNGTSFQVNGLDSSATISLVAEVIRQNRGLTFVQLANVDLTPELGNAISGCERLVHLDLQVPELDAQMLSPEKLGRVAWLTIGSKRQPKHLDSIMDFPKLKRLKVVFQTFDDGDATKLASIPGLEYLEIESGYCGPLTAKAVGRNANLRRLHCRQDCLLDDASLNSLLENRNLLSLDIGGYLSEESIMKLAAASKLERLSLRTSNYDEVIASRLEKSFSALKSFTYGPQQLSFGNILQGSDGFERWVPGNNRSKYDALEGRSLQSFFGGHEHADFLQRLDGKVALVEFWGTWCGPCIAYESELERLYAKYRHDGLQIVSIHSQQGHEKCDDYLKHHPRQWELKTDTTGGLAESFNVSSYPSVYLFDARGKLTVALAHRLVLDRTISRLLLPDAISPR